MAGYTKRNLAQDVEDQAPKFGYSPNLEFRMAAKPLETEQSALSLLRIAPGFRLPFGHSHQRQEEIYVLVSGSARLKLDDEVLELGPWDAVRIHPDTTRNLEAGPDGAELLLFAAPNAGSGDVEMTQGWWIDA
jgi:quercetin dioxygenase-like cupin family protein